MELHGHITPLKLDFLEEILIVSLKRYDLLDIVAKYKEKQCYKDAIKKQEKLLKKRKSRKQKKQIPLAALQSASLYELLVIKSASESSRLHQFQVTSRCF